MGLIILYSRDTGGLFCILLVISLAFALCEYDGLLEYVISMLFICHRHSWFLMFFVSIFIFLIACLFLSCFPRILHSI
ncbi:hypothetical protein BDZ91DRAFT_709866 [Kalaharituber pfeilii]|nr:hypothetical protein BDZ91DRAFT_709866 [Kalaharituber pfeilii]